MFRQDNTCPALLVACLFPQINFRLRGYHPLWPVFPDRSAKIIAKTRWLLQFRSPLLSESRLISFPPLTQMFQFCGFASFTLFYSGKDDHKWPGFPIRKSSDQSLFARSPRLLRPSSPVIAKASTICTYSLDPIALSTTKVQCLGTYLIRLP